jgi:hypothetical protein
MNKIAKKVVIFSLVGLLQAGLGTAVLEASPRQAPPPQAHADREAQEHRMQAEKDRHEQERQHRLQAERERHDREMVRHQHESEWAWRERQREENERHDRMVRDIMAAAVVYAVLTH